MWRCLLLSCLLVRCFPVTGPSLLCSSAVALLVCRWSIVGLLESVLLSCRCPVAVLSLSCRCPVAGLPLVCLLGLGVARPSRLSLVFLLGSG